MLSIYSALGKNTVGTQAIAEVAHIETNQHRFRIRSPQSFKENRADESHISGDQNFHPSLIDLLLFFLTDRRILPRATIGPVTENARPCDRPLQRLEY